MLLWRWLMLVEMLQAAWPVSHRHTEAGPLHFWTHQVHPAGAGWLDRCISGHIRSILLGPGGWTAVSLDTSGPTCWGRVAGPLYLWTHQVPPAGTGWLERCISGHIRSLLLGPGGWTAVSLDTSRSLLLGLGGWTAVSLDTSGPSCWDRVAGPLYLWTHPGPSCWDRVAGPLYLWTHQVPPAGTKWLDRCISGHIQVPPAGTGWLDRCISGHIRSFLLGPGGWIAVSLDTSGPSCWDQVPGPLYLWTHPGPSCWDRVAGSLYLWTHQVPPAGTGWLDRCISGHIQVPPAGTGWLDRCISGHIRSFLLGPGGWIAVSLDTSGPSCWGRVAGPLHLWTHQVPPAGTGWLDRCISGHIRSNLLGPGGWTAVSLDTSGPSCWDRVAGALYLWTHQVPPAGTGWLDRCISGHIQVPPAGTGWLDRCISGHIRSFLLGPGGWTAVSLDTSGPSCWDRVAGPLYLWTHPGPSCWDRVAGPLYLWTHQVLPAGAGWLDRCISGHIRSLLLGPSGWTAVSLDTSRSLLLGPDGWTAVSLDTSGPSCWGRVAGSLYLWTHQVPPAGTKWLDRCISGHIQVPPAVTGWLDRCISGHIRSLLLGPGGWTAVSLDTSRSLLLGPGAWTAVSLDTSGPSCWGRVAGSLYLWTHQVLPAGAGWLDRCISGHIRSLLLGPGGWIAVSLDTSGPSCWGRVAGPLHLWTHQVPPAGTGWLDRCISGHIRSFLLGPGGWTAASLDTSGPSCWGRVAGSLYLWTHQVLPAGPGWLDRCISGHIRSLLLGPGGWIAVSLDTSGPSCWDRVAGPLYLWTHPGPSCWDQVAGPLYLWTHQVPPAGPGVSGQPQKDHWCSALLRWLQRSKPQRGAHFYSFTFLG
ncbi:hypothetical protein NDU88_000369 [Pleurodeles waltl]|uniref:Uncharacterized protein n=1 Tax=Pleurodeles waltl TaxID=8319 RepID=A0AAV7V5H7_PLEWA|nr:hypothetical protein NDU88_000369 [Pleurodeles waltl]